MNWKTHKQQRIVSNIFVSYWRIFNKWLIKIYCWAKATRQCLQIMAYLSDFSETMESQKAHSECTITYKYDQRAILSTQISVCISNCFGLKKKTVKSKDVYQCKRHKNACWIWSSLSTVPKFCMQQKEQLAFDTNGYIQTNSKANKNKIKSACQMADWKWVKDKEEKYRS